APTQRSIADDAALLPGRAPQRGGLDLLLQASHGRPRWRLRQGRHLQLRRLTWRSRATRASVQLRMTRVGYAVAVTSDSRTARVPVVTGAAGWLGQNLVRALAGHRERVRCLVHDAEQAPLLEIVAPSIETVVGDVRDPATVDRLFDAIGPAAVFNAAGVIHPGGRTRELFDVNVGGAQLVLDRARRTGVTRFVHVSSNSPFGANATPNQ